MKKLIVFVLALLFTLSLVGCNLKNDGKEQISDGMPNKWGITLETANVTPKGLTLVCHQLGGEAVFELNTGSFYGLQKLEGAEWIDVEFVPQEYEVAWTSEAWLIQKGSTTEWDINWGWLYGELSSGEYRIVKPISNFRGTGDYDNETFYAGFIIE